MPKKRDYESMTVAEQIREGLKEAISNVQGRDLTLRTTVMPSLAPVVPPRKVVALRNRLGMSQSVFAAYLNVSVKTIQSWEQGTREPKAGEARLLQVMGMRPQQIKRLIEAA